MANSQETIFNYGAFVSPVFRCAFAPLRAKKSMAQNTESFYRILSTINYKQMKITATKRLKG